jgi:hypothetical protein
MTAKLSGPFFSLFSVIFSAISSRAASHEIPGETPIHGIIRVPFDLCDLSVTEMDKNPTFTMA